MPGSHRRRGPKGGARLLAPEGPVTRHPPTRSPLSPAPAPCWGRGFPLQQDYRTPPLLCCSLPPEAGTPRRRARPPTHRLLSLASPATFSPSSLYTGVRRLQCPHLRSLASSGRADGLAVGCAGGRAGGQAGKWAGPASCQWARQSGAGQGGASAARPIFAPRSVELCTEWAQSMGPVLRGQLHKYAAPACKSLRGRTSAGVPPAASRRPGLTHPQSRASCH